MQALIISVTTFLVLLLAPPTTGTAEIFKGFPDAILCKYQAAAAAGDVGGEVIFHVHSREDTGVVLYKVFGRRPVILKIGPDKVVDAGNIKDCHGKTVTQLREDGQAFDFRTSPPRP